MELSLEELVELYNERLAKDEERRKKTLQIKRKRAKEVKLLKRRLLLYATTFSIGFGTLSFSNYMAREKNIFDGNTVTIDDNKKEKLFNELHQDIEKELKTADLPENIEIENDNLLVLRALFNNENLTDKEKEIVCQLTDLLIDNEYLNKELAYDSLEKVDVVASKKPKEVKKEVVAQYSYLLEQIETYIKENDSYYTETLVHEFIHCLFSNENTKCLPKYLAEGMTELLSNEYYAEQPFVEEKSYPFEVIMVKELCNLVGANNVLKAYSTGNMKFIEKELGTITSKEETKLFLKNIKDIFDSFSKEEKVDSTKLDEVITYLCQCSEKLYEQDEKTERLEESTYNISILNILSTKDPYYNYYEYIYENGVYIKPYFSSKLKEKYQDEYFSDYFKALELTDTKVKSKKDDIK